MELITILNHCHRHRGFVYQHARFAADKQSIEVDVRPRVGSAAICSGCHQPAPGYDHLPQRRFEFIPLWGFLVFLLYRMRRVACRNCGVVVEEVPWCDGKHQLTRAYMLFLARWARKLSWKETAESFHTSWDKVCDAVEYCRFFIPSRGHRSHCRASSNWRAHGRGGRRRLPRLARCVTHNRTYLAHRRGLDSTIVCCLAEPPESMTAGFLVTAETDPYGIAGPPAAGDHAPPPTGDPAAGH